MIRHVAVFSKNVEQFRAHAMERAALEGSELDLTRNILTNGEFLFFYVDSPDKLKGCQLYNYEYWGEVPPNFWELRTEAHQRMRKAPDEYQG